MRYLLTSATMLLLLFTGCGFLTGPPGWTSDDDYVEDWDVPEDYVAIDGRVEGAWVGGQMADIGTFEGDAYGAEYTGGYGYSSLTLHAGATGGDDFGWAMIRLGTDDPGGFESDNFAPGSTVTSVNATGCTGPSHGNYIFDGGAEQVTVSVEFGPTENSRLFHYFAEFSGQGYTEGSFVLYMD